MVMEEYLMNFEINLSDIFYFERDYYFNNSTGYRIDKTILQKIQSIILKKIKSDYPLKLTGENTRDLNYHERYFKAQETFEEELAISYFISGDKYYDYQSSIVFNRKDFDFDFWFALKLRQYAKQLILIDELLNFQLKTNFDDKHDEFINFLKVCLKQNKNVLTKDVIEEVGEYINKVSPKSKVNKKPQKKQSLNLNGRTEFFWTGWDPILKNQQLKYLREELLGNHLIEEIKQSIFDNHFNGKIQNGDEINWKQQAYPLIYLIDNLKQYLSPAIYKGKDGSISISQFSPHFYWLGKPINNSNFDKYKSENNRKNKQIFISIDNIINNLPTKT